MFEDYAFTVTDFPSESNIVFENLVIAPRKELFASLDIFRKRNTKSMFLVHSDLCATRRGRFASPCVRFSTRLCLAL